MPCRYVCMGGGVVRWGLGVRYSLTNYYTMYYGTVWRYLCHYSEYLRYSTYCSMVAKVVVASGGLLRIDRSPKEREREREIWTTNRTEFGKRGGSGYEIADLHDDDVQVWLLLLFLMM